MESVRVTGRLDRFDTSPAFCSYVIETVLGFGVDPSDFLVTNGWRDTYDSTGTWNCIVYVYDPEIKTVLLLHGDPFSP